MDGRSDGDRAVSGGSSTERERHERRRFRRRDPIDYAVVAVVALLVYLHLPFRPAIRSTLRAVAALPASLPSFAGVAVPVEVTLWVLALLGLGGLLSLFVVARRSA
jgi:hypothetical protein